jgi:hypothetical protein
MKVTAIMCSSLLWIINIAEAHRGHGRKGKRLAKLCEAMATGVDACPTRNGACPERGICKKGSISGLCAAVAESEDCTVSGFECANFLTTKCGCDEDTIECATIEVRGSGP